MDALDWGLIAGIAAHCYLQLQSYLQPSGFGPAFPAFVPGMAVVIWSAACVWGSIRVPDLKRVFQCLGGFLLFAASAPLVAIARPLPFPLSENASTSFLGFTFASYAATALIIRSFGLSPWTASQNALLSNRLHRPAYAMAGAFLVSLGADYLLRGSEWIPVISGWCFLAPFALNLALVRQIPEATAREMLRSPESWRRWLGRKTVLGIGGLMVLSGSLAAIFLRQSSLLHPAPDVILQQLPWGPQFLFVLRQSYRLWFPIASMLVLQIFAVLKIGRFAQQLLPPLSAPSQSSLAGAGPQASAKPQGI